MPYSVCSVQSTSSVLLVPAVAFACFVVEEDWQTVYPPAGVKKPAGHFSAAVSGDKAYSPSAADVQVPLPLAEGSLYEPAGHIVTVVADLAVLAPVQAVPAGQV